MKLFRKATSRILPIAALTLPPSSLIPILSACFSAWSLMVPAFLKGQSFDFPLKTINGKNRKALKQNTLVCLFMTVNRGRGKKKRRKTRKNNDSLSLPPPPPPRDRAAAGILQIANLHNTWVQLFLQNFTTRTAQNNNKIFCATNRLSLRTVQTKLAVSPESTIGEFRSFRAFTFSLQSVAPQLTPLLRPANSKGESGLGMPL